MNFLLIALLADDAVTRWDPAGIIILKLATIAALVGISGFCVAGESAIIKVGAIQPNPRGEEGNARARFAKYTRPPLDASLPATQFGVPLASLALGWVGKKFLPPLIEP